VVGSLPVTLTQEVTMVTLAQTWCDGNGPGAWWPIFPITFWALVLLGVFLWFRRSRGDRLAVAEATLADRYARGDISEEEYRSRLDVLRNRRD
jgi:putative membrane protein